MKSKVVIVILLLVCAGLGVALVSRENKARKEKEDLAQRLTYQTEEVKETKAKLDEQRQVNMSLEGDLKSRASELSNLSNNLNKVIVDLEKSDAAAKATADQLRAAQAELAKKDSKIGELETERTALGKHMDTLTNSIGSLEQQIASTQSKLTRAEGDKDLLWKELKRLQAEKAELERQFNDFAVMRAQVSKLKEELAISRRLEFIRLSLFGSTAKGGAEKLMPHTDKNPANRGSATNYNLDVEIRQSGTSSVIEPSTNSSPAPILAPVATNAAAVPRAPAISPTAAK